MKYLVTGGSGFLGRALITRLLAEGKQVRVVARNEGGLLSLPDEVEKVTGNIADEFTCEQCMKDICGVYHLAGFKHVGWAEKQPWECIDTNILGTINILSAAALHKVDFIIATSTDKAAQVSGVYGATKMLMESLFWQFEQFTPSTKFRVVRYGNVMYSTGSVLEKWKKLLQKNEAVTITDPTATRFFWTVDQAVQLLYDCLEKSENSMPFVPRMKSIKMGNLLDCMIEKYGDGVTRVKEIGLQLGENLHETMDGETYSDDCIEYTHAEIMSMV